MKLLTRAEELVLLAVWRLQGRAYSVSIRRQISETTGEEWSLGSVYMPLNRLLKKGYLESYLSEATPDRGGRHKRIYRLSRDGMKELVRTKKVQAKMWQGIWESLPEVEHE